MMGRNHKQDRVVLGWWFQILIPKKLVIRRFPFSCVFFSGDFFTFFTDSTIANHHFSPLFVEYVSLFLSNYFDLSKSKFMVYDTDVQNRSKPPPSL